MFQICGEVERLIPVTASACCRNGTRGVLYRTNSSMGIQDMGKENKFFRAFPFENNLHSCCTFLRDILVIYVFEEEKHVFLF